MPNPNEKDLQYYIDHPDELPTDQDELMRLYAQATEEGDPSTGEGEQDVSVKTEDASSGETKDAVKEDPTQEKAKTAAAEETEAPIATRDGKGTIPFSVLKTEREKRQAAEAMAREMQDRLAAVEEQLAKGTKKGDAAAAELAQEASEAVSDEDMEALREDFPAFAKLLDAANAQISKLTDTVSTLTKREKARDQDAETQVAKTVQELIDDEPVLLHLQTNDPDLWERAVELDNMLKKTGKFTSTADRFAKVAEQMETLFGPFDGVSVKKQTLPASKEKVTDDARTKVAEKLKDVKPAKPQTLSDLPNGEIPETDERSALENLSAVEIGAKLLTMSPEKQREYLNRL